MVFLHFVLLSFCIVRADVSQSSANYFREFMQKFENNDRSIEDELPPKYDINGYRLETKTQYSVDDKIKFRQKIIRSQYKPFFAMNNKNLIENFFKNGSEIEKTLEKLDAKAHKYALEVAPWSGDYWPTYRGGVAARYADGGFPKNQEFKDYYEAYKKYRSNDLSNQAQIDNLSPAEKYDILVGDENFSLTKWSFEEANEVYKAGNDKIESWYGLCHGWAPASFMMDRPQDAIEYKIEKFQGKNFSLKFFPDDVKALASLLWANTTLETYFIGGRCQEANPKKDEDGRILDEDCNDVNPGTWHMALINQLGIGKHSFVMDATYDAEVWNQPVLGFQFNYFQPQSKKASEAFKDALIQIEDFSDDKFKKYRSKNARFIVGVNLILSYVVEAVASHQEKNSSENDFTRNVQYIYDLELDENGRIIGGEWYQSIHPDFIWSPDISARAVSVMDWQLQGTWNGNHTVPDQWSDKAVFAAGNYGQPLAKVVEGLIARAHKY